MKVYKKIKWATVLLIMAGGVSSCQQTMNISEKTIEPLTQSDDVNTFFEKYLPASFYSLPECFFFDNDDKTDKCVIINNVDKFRKSFSCSSAMLPAINFELNTLIIGQYRVSSICDYIVKQKVVVKSDEAEVYINWNCRDDLYGLGSFATLRYWGIYPKFQVKKISLIINNKKSI